MLVAFVADDDDGGCAAEAVDQFEPVFDPVFVFAGAAVADEEVEAAFGEEELVGSVVDFLAAKVPNVEANVFGVDVDVPGGDVESVGLGLVGVELAVDQAVEQGSFADAALTNQQQFCFIQGANFTTAELAEVVADVFYGARIFTRI